MVALDVVGSVRCGATRPNGMAKGISSSTPCPCGVVGGPSVVQCVRPESRRMIVLKVLDRSKINERFRRFRGRIGSFRVRAAEQPSWAEKVREIASDEAAEGPGNAQRNAKLKADELKSEDESATELPVAAELLLSVLKEEDESAQTVLAEQDAALDVASSSAVEDPKHFFEDVKEDAKSVAADLGRSVEDQTVGLQNTAEGLEARQSIEAELVKEEFDDDETSSSSSSSEDESEPLPASRAEVEKKITETAKDGFEVLQWAVEGAVSAGDTARQGLGVAREAIDKRVKSFSLAADETKEISSQAADVAQKTFGEMHGSASKFGQELEVTIKEKKAADSLKPESERSPLSKVTQGVQGSFEKATAKDGPLAQLNESLSENFSKASQAGQQFTSRVSERAAELSSKAKASAEEMTSDLGSSFKKRDITTEYEDERGNELLKGQIPSEDQKTPLKFDVDEAQTVPSKQQDGSDIGPDE